MPWSKQSASVTPAGRERIPVTDKLKHVADRLQGVLSYWGLARDLDLLDLYAYLDFTEKYNLVGKPNERCIRVVDLCTRWDIAPQEFRPEHWARACLLLSDGSLKEISSIITFSRLWDLHKDAGTTSFSDEFWYLVPAWWWFKRDFVEFYEKHQPELATKAFPLSPKWRTPSEVCTRWQVSLYKLEGLARDKGLVLYSLDGDNFKSVTAEEWVKPTLAFMGGAASRRQCSFLASDIQDFESLNFKILGLNQNRLDCLHVQDQALELLYESPGLLRKDAVNQLRDKSPGNSYSDKTVKEWIKPIFLPQKPGRPRKRPA